MILLVSSQPRDATALAGLCESRGWLVQHCDSVRATQRRLRRGLPRTLLLRHRLADGYSDQILSQLADSHAHRLPRTIVMVEAGTPSRLEARLLELGADTVLRDPLRVEVLLAYVAKYERATPRCSAASSRSAPAFVAFAGGQFYPASRIFRHGRNSVHLTRREAQLAEQLGGAPGEVVTYESMYAEILHRLFQGDTSNMRVLLRKLDQSLARTGVRLRDWVEVIPKSGYRFRTAPQPLRR